MRNRSMAAAGAVLAFVFAGGAMAQVSSINSDILHVREFNDDSNSVLTVVNNYPSLVSFDDRQLDGDGMGGEFANRHVWRFSNDGGGTAYAFNNNDFFNVSMSVTLDGTVSPRKEAGYLFDTAGGQGQFIVNTDAHEIVAFGGPLPFFAFPATFMAGQTITLGMEYFLDTNDGMRKVIYHAGALSSPALAFTNLEQGIIDGSTLGGYVQGQIAVGNPANFVSAQFANITIIPTPGAAGLVLLGIGAGLRRRR
jgi:hypothetical protein